MKHFNCMGKGDGLRCYVRFEIAPVRDRGAGSGDGSDYCVTSPARADVWTLYGRLPSGQAVALDDALTVEAGAHALRAAVARVPRPVAYLDDSRWIEAPGIAALAGVLTEMMLAMAPVSPPVADREALVTLIGALRR